MTESCDKNELRLITDIDVRSVTAADNYFLQDVIKQSQQIVVGKIETVHADGATNQDKNVSGLN